MATALELPTIDALRQEQRALREVLTRLRRRLRLELLLELAADAAVVLAGAGIILVFLDWFFRFSVPVRVVLLFLTLAGVLTFLGVRALHRWRASRLDELTLAMTLDRHRPGTGQQIADVLQLPDLLNDSETSANSPAMVRLAVQRACAALSGSDWRSLWNRKRTALSILAMIAGLLVPLSFAIAAPRAARLSAARWLRGSRERWPQQTYMTVMGLNNSGALLAPRDERFPVDVRTDLPLLELKGDEWIVNGRGEPTTLWSKRPQPKVPASVIIKERSAEGKVRNGAMTQSGPANFTFELPASSTSSAIDLTGGDDWLGPITVERVDRPALAETRLRVKEPGATYSGFRTIEDPSQHLLFLPDTEIELTLVGTESISAAKVKIQADKLLPLGARRRPDLHGKLEAHRGHHARNHLDLGKDRARLETDVSLDRTTQRSGAAGHPAGFRHQRPRHADRNDSAGDLRDRRFRAGGASAPDRAHRERRRKVAAGDQARQRDACRCRSKKIAHSWTIRPATRSTCRPTRPRSEQSSGSPPRPTIAAPRSADRPVERPPSPGRFTRRALL